MDSTDLLLAARMLKNAARDDNQRLLNQQEAVERTRRAERAADLAREKALLASRPSAPTRGFNLVFFKNQVDAFELSDDPLNLPKVTALKVAIQKACDQNCTQINDFIHAEVKSLFARIETLKDSLRPRFAESQAAEALRMKEVEMEARSIRESETRMKVSAVLDDYQSLKNTVAADEVVSAAFSFRFKLVSFLKGYLGITTFLPLDIVALCLLPLAFGSQEPAWGLFWPVWFAKLTIGFGGCFLFKKHLDNDYRAKRKAAIGDDYLGSRLHEPRHYRELLHAERTGRWRNEIQAFENRGGQ